VGVPGAATAGALGPPKSTGGRGGLGLGLGLQLWITGRDNSTILRYRLPSPDRRA